MRETYDGPKENCNRLFYGQPDRRITVKQLHPTAMKLQIKQIRQARGLGQGEVALQAGIRPATLSEIESGKREPEIRTLEAIAAAIGCSVLDLIVDDRDLTSRSLLLAIRSLSTSQKQALLQIVEPMVAKPPKT